MFDDIKFIFSILQMLAGQVSASEYSSVFAVLRLCPPLKFQWIAISPASRPPIFQLCSN